MSGCRICIIVHVDPPGDLCPGCAAVVQVPGVSLDDQLSGRQAALLEAIFDLREHLGYGPSLREIGSVVGMKSTNGVSEMLSRVERKGYITRQKLLSRSLGVTPRGEKWATGKRWRVEA